jgi:hypothetical protein
LPKANPDNLPVESNPAKGLATLRLAALGCQIDVRLDGAAKFGRDGTGFAGGDLSKAISRLAREADRKGYRV